MIGFGECHRCSNVSKDEITSYLPIELALEEIAFDGIDSNVTIDAERRINLGFVVAVIWVSLRIEIHRGDVHPEQCPPHNRCDRFSLSNVLYVPEDVTILLPNGTIIFERKTIHVTEIDGFKPIH
jgi:hypothetical protein